MPRACTVCAHPERHEIEQALVNRSASYRVIASRHSLTQAAVGRHVRGGHIAALLAKAREAEQTARADEILMDVRRIGAKTILALSAAEKARDWSTMLRAVREARENARLLAELRGRLDSRPVINIVTHPEYLEARTLIVQALDPYPEARNAVVKALEGGGGASG